MYVISKTQKPLMPIERHGKVRRLLMQKLVKAVERESFTIKPLYNTLQGR
ncbi:RRXRR domain-containing protein [Pseudothermotoga sp. U03pept]